MAEMARYINPKTRYIELLTAAEAERRGWESFPAGGEPEFVDEDEYPKHLGGGTYELSNGERVHGKEEAEAAEAELRRD